MKDESQENRKAAWEHMLQRANECANETASKLRPNQETSKTKIARPKLTDAFNKRQ